MQFQDIANSFIQIEKQAKIDGVDVELSGSLSESFSAGYVLGKLHKYSASTSHAASMRVIAGKGVGMATTESLDTDSLVLCYQEAKQSAFDLAKSADPNKPVDEMLPPANTLKLDGLISDQLDRVPVATKLKWAESLESDVLAISPVIKNVPYSGYADSKNDRFIFNSKGQRLHFVSGGGHAYTYALGGEGDDKVSSYKGIFFRNPKQFNPNQLAKEVGQSTLNLVGAVKPKTGKYAVVFENEVAAELFGAMLSHFSAKEVAEESSKLKGKLKTEVFSKLLSLSDDPLAVQQSGARPFDSEGVPGQRTSLVQNGVLLTYLTNNKYAKMFNLPNTGNASSGAGEMDIAPSNIFVAAGEKSFDELLKSKEEVLLITQFEGGMHSGFNDVTGDFSLPASGFIYKNGKKSHAVNQFVVSGNLFELLKNVSAISNRLTNDNGAVVAPDLFVENISVAGE
jgi:PmbA protein